VPRASGQALTEGVLSILLLAACLAAAAGVFRSEWNRLRCAFQVFEATRARLNLNSGSDERRVRGSGRCGQASETVELIRLEHARW
jgi:hypothetical protein